MRSIRFRFATFLAGLLFLFLFVLNYYPVLLSRNAVFEEKQIVMSSRASSAAASLSAVGQRRAGSLGEVLAYLGLDDFDRVVVADERAEILYDSAGDGTPFDRRDIRAALNGKTVFRSHFGTSGFLSSVAVPLAGRGSPEGVLYLQELDTERAEGIWAVQRRLRVFSFAIGALALVLAAGSVILITRRLRELERSMRIAADGDYHRRHTVRGHDEISALGHEFNSLTERLERTETMRRRFIADASHELKTPLATIRLLSDSLLQSGGKMEEDTLREFVAGIREETLRLQHTTEKLLTLSRLDSEPPARRETVDLAQVARDAADGLRPLAEEKGLSLSLELGEGCRISGTQDGADQIIRNLLENAVKYNVPDGAVRLRLRAEEKDVFLEVEDTGIGIPDADMPLIFDRFYRVDKARSREAGGSGLGLSIVHNAVLAMGGEIRVGHNFPQGTRFVVRFPRAQSEETET